MTLVLAVDVALLRAFLSSLGYYQCVPVDITTVTLTTTALFGFTAVVNFLDFL